MEKETGINAENEGRVREENGGIRQAGRRSDERDKKYGVYLRS
jgi:hypothetical protein